MVLRPVGRRSTARPKPAARTAGRQQQRGRHILQLDGRLLAACRRQRRLQHPDRGLGRHARRQLHQRPPRHGQALEPLLERGHLQMGKGYQWKGWAASGAGRGGAGQPVRSGPRKQTSWSFPSPPPAPAAARGPGRVAGRPGAARLRVQARGRGGAGGMSARRSLPAGAAGAGKQVREAVRSQASKPPKTP